MHAFSIIVVAVIPTRTEGERTRFSVGKQKAICSEHAGQPVSEKMVCRAAMATSHSDYLSESEISFPNRGLLFLSAPQFPTLYVFANYFLILIYGIFWWLSPTLADNNQWTLQKWI